MARMTAKPIASAVDVRTAAAPTRASGPGRATGREGETGACATASPKYSRRRRSIVANSVRLPRTSVYRGAYGDFRLGLALTRLPFKPGYSSI